MPIDTPQAPEICAPDKVPEFFKFYEEAAGRTKSHAWTQSTWLLTLNGAILALSLNLYVEHASVRGFLFIEWLLTLGGLVLCVYIAFVLRELGRYIQKYVTAANRLAAQSPYLAEYIGWEDAAAARQPCYRAAFPIFIARLMLQPAFFAIAHLAWGIYVTVVEIRA